MLSNQRLAGTTTKRKNLSHFPLNDIVEVRCKFFDWITMFNRDYDVFLNG